MWNVDIVGMDGITAKIGKVDVSKVPELFRGISMSDIDRPCGEIHVLIGADHCELLPTVSQINQDLQLMENQSGFSIRGRHGISGEIN